MARMFWLPLSVVLAGLPILFLAFRAFDRLVRHQRQNYAAAWRADGCPRPLLFPKDWPKSLGSSWATQRCSMVWPLRTPAWVKGDAAAMAHLRSLRRFVLLWNFVVMPSSVAALLFAVLRR